jgi:hypothetical protein
MSNNVNARIKDALNPAAEKHCKHIDATLRQRSSTCEEQCGSVILASPELIFLMLTNARWRPYTHPNIMSGCEAFETPDIGGLVGVLDLSQSNSDTKLSVREQKDNGMYMAESDYPEDCDESPPSSSYTVIILGYDPEAPESDEIAFTFHPGAPIRPSSLTKEELIKCGFEPDSNGDFLLTPNECIAVGLEYAKVRHYRRTPVDFNL